MAKRTAQGSAAVVSGEGVRFRVRFVLDEDHQFEECNGEARPLTEAEYRGNEYRACPDHPRGGTKVVDWGTAKDGSGQVQGCAICSRTDYQDISYDEYRAYYGNPDRHVYLQLEVQKGCPCCGAWAHVGGLGGIDFMDDAKELDAITLGDWIAEEGVKGLPGYLREVAEEDLNEARGA